MESVDLGMGEIFSDVDDDDIAAPGVLPDLPEGGEQDQGDNDDDAENTEVLSRLKDLSKGAAKKVIRRPQPKLDPTRLTGNRGIPVLPKMCEKLKFKGKGHEVQDLGTLMRALEHWSHRLFPKMPFDEVLDRCERLGAKKEVQTCIKKMRLNLPVLDDDFVNSDKDDADDGDDDVVRRNDTNDDNVEDEWDNMLREEAQQNASRSTGLSGPAVPDDLDIAGPSTSTAIQPSQATPATPGPSTGATHCVGFTPDQLERMEKNREVARQKRLTKTGIHSSPATPLSKNVPDPSLLVAHDLASSQSPRLQLPVTTVMGDAGSRSQPGATVCVDTETSAGGGGDEDHSGKVDKDSNKDITPASEGERTGDSEMEMSEVLEKRETCVAKFKAEDAQHWDAESEVVGKDSDTLKDTEESSSVDTDTHNTDTLITGTHNTASVLNDDCEMSEVIDKQDDARSSQNTGSGNERAVVCNDSDTVQSAVGSNGDSAEMSEVIGYQGSSAKPKPLADFQNIQKDSEAFSDIIPKQNYTAIADKNKMVNGNLADEDIEGMDSESTIDPSNKENTSTDNARTLKKCNKVGSVAEIGDNEAMDDFDDELTEEQLMETLE